MKHFLLLIALVASLSLNAQITKNNWLVGGSAAFSYTENDNQSNSNNLRLSLSPNIGYFFLDKLALGPRPNYFLNRGNSDSGTSKSERIILAPFVRYYFLEAEKKINVFAEGAYNLDIDVFGDGDNPEDFEIKAGLAIFLNSSVALETSLSYINSNSKNQFVGNHTFLLGFGLQIHLEKL
ncbi:outer membrane beta-barrel protein [Psychroflexus tropicus]|uniref:outer membrane beta-barrel protein n=1 Tax=Psychroflexus tropicus TaxID=197345 RepID=UPI000381EE84|nr:outer membrane beta-barrel protein [Psychroflexus tropicus]